MALTQTAEDYLEQIYLLSLRLSTVKTSDIARELGVKTPSVISAVKLLKSRGLVYYERYGNVTLSERGLERALDVYERHKTLYRFLKFVLGVSDDVASSNACGMELAMSPQTLAAIKDLFAFLAWKKSQGEDLQDEFRAFKQRTSETQAGSKTASEHTNGALPLSDGKDNVPYTIVELGGERAVRRRLLDMGVIPGETVTIQNRGPLGFPLEIAIQGYVLTLRKDEAEAVIVREA